MIIGRREIGQSGGSLDLSLILDFIHSTTVKEYVKIEDKINIFKYVSLALKNRL